MPPKKAIKAKAKVTKKNEVEESEDDQEEEKQTKRATRSSSVKKQSVKHKKNKDEDDEEGPKKSAKNTGRQSSATKKQTTKGNKKIKDDDEEENEEEEQKPTPKRNTRSTRSKSKDTITDPQSKMSSGAKADSKAAKKASTKKTAKAKAAVSESEASGDDKNTTAKPSSPKPAIVKKAPTKKRSKKRDSGWSPYSGRSYGYGSYGYRNNFINDDNSDASDKPKNKWGGRKKTKVADAEVDLEAKVELDSEITLKDIRVLALKGKEPYDYYVEEEDQNDPEIKKFFHMQILDNYKSTFDTHYFTFYKWGKDGQAGEWSLRGFFDQKRAIKIYDEKIEERNKYKKWKGHNAAKKENSASQDQTQSQDTQQGSQAATDTQVSQDGVNKSQSKDEEKMQEENKEEKNDNPVQTEGKKGMEEPTTEKTDNIKGMEEEKKEDKKNEKIENKEQGKAMSSKLDLDKIECPVDKCCVLRDETEVLIKDDEIFDMKYNTSDIQRNSNHFYTFQILRHLNDRNKHYIFSRYGRVGIIGEWVLRGVYTEAQAIEAYRAKQKEKKDTNKYKALEMSYTKDDPEILTKAFQEAAGKSKLDKRVSDFIQLIFDFKMMDSQMVQAGYDPKKLPLGKLSLNMIDEGFAKLKEISEALKTSPDENTLMKLCSEFYTVIPQNVGWKNMKTMVIRDNNTIKEKLEFLESLRQIQIAYQMVHGLTESSEKTNPIDANYEKLKCDIEPVDTNSEEYKKVSEYINNTKENFEVEILEMFKINKHGSSETFKKDLDNHLMLWHGSRLTNFVGILSQGLRIAPPEAPASGYRLGKGIYLADMISKSIPYCYASGSNGIFCIMVCDSSLGNFNEKLNDDFYASNLPANKHSTKALGRVAPPLSSYKEFEKGVMIPSGKAEKTKHEKSAFMHNEYIVYDVNQVQIRYLLKMRQKSRGLFY